MKRLWLICALMLMLVMAACTPAAEETNNTDPAGDTTAPEADVPALASVTPSPAPAGDDMMEETPMPAETEGEVVTPVEVDLSELTPAPTVLGTPQEMPLPGGIDPVQDMTHAMSQDLAKRLGIDVSEVTVVSVEEVTWPDGSMGCPEPGMGYIQMLIPGFLATLEAQGEEYTYHAASAQQFVLCGADGVPVPTP